MSFVHPLWGGWSDLWGLAAMASLAVFGPFTVTGVVIGVLVASVAARLGSRSFAATLTPAGVSLTDRDRKLVPWPSIERLEAVQGLLTRYVRLTVRGQEPVVLRTPVAARLAAPAGFDAAVAEFARWATAYGDDLTITPVTLTSRQASRFAAIGLRAIMVGALVANVLLRIGPIRTKAPGWRCWWPPSSY